MQEARRDAERAGPLAGIKVIEMEGVGPGPFAAMWLADMGVTVIRVSRPGQRYNQTRRDVLNRSRQSIAVNLKKPGAVEIVLRLIDRADALIEGFRPGVMERLGLGPDVCLARRPALVYGRVTGWGQKGAYAQMAGHDINYISLSGLLHGMGPADGRPAQPLNLIGDFGGGGMLLVAGLLAALLESARGGKGQVVDAAMADGASLLGAMIWGLLRQGLVEGRARVEPVRRRGALLRHISVHGRRIRCGRQHRTGVLGGDARARRYRQRTGTRRT